MFNGSSNIVIQGGIFIIAGNIDCASLKEMGANLPQNSAIGSAISTTGQEPTTDQFSYAQEANAQESYKPQVDPAPLSHSVPATEYYSTYLSMPTPSVTSSSDVTSWDTVDASRRNAKPIIDSLPAPSPIPMPIEEMGASISQDSAIMGSNTGRRPNSADQFSYAQEANAQESCQCKPQVDPAPRSHSVHASGQAPDYSPYLMPTPSITSEVKSWETVDASRRNTKPNVDSHVAAPPPFPMPSYFSKPQYGAHTAPPIQFRKRHPSCPPSQSSHSQFGASPTSYRHQVRMSTCPSFPTPSFTFPIPQLVSGAHYF